MRRSKRFFKKAVVRRISERVEESFQHHFKFSKTKLWHCRKSSSNRRLAVRLALYKDIADVSYDHLLTLLPSGIHWSKHTLLKNQERVRREMKKWAKIVMSDEIISQYQNSSKQKGTVFFKKKPLFLLDSTNFRVEGFEGITKKNKLWSYKLNGPGRRFMILSDANGVPMRVFGGYSPKIYDGRWVEQNRKWLDKHLKNSSIIADCHFWSAQRELKAADLYPIMPKTVKSKDGYVRVGLHIYDVEDNSFNFQQREMKTIRSAVERPFAQMEKMFSVLSNVFLCRERDLDCVVKFAAAVLLMKSRFYI